MSASTRRGFLKTSYVAMGVSALCTPLVAGPTIRDESDTGAARATVFRATVFTVFQGFAPSPDDTDHQPTSSTEIASRLQKACPDITFTFRDLTTGTRWEAVLNEVTRISRWRGPDRIRASPDSETHVFRGLSD